jgi:hypothetical protein
MNTKDYISIQLFSSHYDIPVSFIKALDEFQLIETTVIQDELHIPKAQIKDVENMMRLHFELDINLEGLDVIYNLLKRMESLQQEIVALNNKLNRFNNY